jgi:hypothetical protein
MSGRPPIKVYQYDENGKYIQSYNCTNDARSKYYGNAAYPMFRDQRSDKLHKLPDNTYLCRTRLGRDNVKFEVARMHNDFSLFGLKELNEPMQILNLDGVVIAEFRNVYLASKLLNIPTTRLTQMSNSTNRIPQNERKLRTRFAEPVTEGRL